MNLPRCRRTAGAPTVRSRRPARLTACPPGAVRTGCGPGPTALGSPDRAQRRAPASTLRSPHGHPARPCTRAAFPPDAGAEEDLLTHRQHPTGDDGASPAHSSTIDFTESVPEPFSRIGDSKGVPAPIQADKRWVVERTHGWMNGFGKLRRCTETKGTVGWTSTSPRSLSRSACSSAVPPAVPLGRTPHLPAPQVTPTAGRSYYSLQGEAILPIRLFLDVDTVAD